MVEDREPGQAKQLAALRVGDEFRGTFLLKRVELKKTRGGKDYLDLEVGDRTGSLPGKLWDAEADLYRTLRIAGAFRHDIGKVEELSIARALEYSDRGRLIGHIVTGVLWIEERARRVPGFPEALLDQLKHLVLSHHGEHEWGSPVLP